MTFELQHIKYLIDRNLAGKDTGVIYDNTEYELEETLDYIDLYDLAEHLKNMGERFDPEISG